MKKIYYLLACLFVLGSCFDDKGNYDYNPINDVAIKGFGTLDTVYRGLYLIDTLHFRGELDCTLDKEVKDENYMWRWELEKSIYEREIIAETRNLDLPLNMTPGAYKLHLRVKDLATGIVHSVSESISVELSYSKGLYILSDRENEEVQLDMVAIIESIGDTIILQDMLKETDLPTLHRAINVMHTGKDPNEETQRVWIMTEEGSYWLSSLTMQGDENNTIWKMFATSLDVPSDAFPVDCFPKLAMGQESGNRTGYVRGFRLNDGSFIFTNCLIGELYSNPINRTRQQPQKLIRCFPSCLYAARYLKSVIFFDMDSRVFLGAAQPEYVPYISTITLLGLPKFRLDQKTYAHNRTCIYMENSRHPGDVDYSDRGRSYALMKDDIADYYIYAFYLGNNQFKADLTAGYWKIKKDIATNLDQATRYMFSSTRNQLYYLVGGKVYCYSFNKDNERCEVVADFGTDEITWWDVDKWTEMTFDHIWVATYNPATGGTLMKFREPQDQNKLEWEKTSTSWGGFPKIKSVSWRNC